MYAFLCSGYKRTKDSTTRWHIRGALYPTTNTIGTASWQLGAENRGVIEISPCSIHIEEKNCRVLVASRHLMSNLAFHDHFKSSIQIQAPTGFAWFTYIESPWRSFACYHTVLQLHPWRIISRAKTVPLYDRHRLCSLAIAGQWKDLNAEILPIIFFQQCCLAVASCIIHK